MLELRPVSKWRLCTKKYYYIVLSYLNYDNLCWKLQIFENSFIFKKISKNSRNSRFKKLKKFKLRLSVSSVQFLFNLWQYTYISVCFYNPMCLIKIDVQIKIKKCFANRGKPTNRTVVTPPKIYVLKFGT